MSVALRIPTPRTEDPRNAPTLRWGIMGPGRIAADFAESLRTHTDQVLAGVGSRTLDRASRFAEEHGVERAYESYEALAAAEDIDVVYVATPHTFHLECARIALEHGKHVLVEKPLGANAEEAEALAALARERGLFAMEAMWARFTPAADAIRQLLEAGTLGELQYFRADLGEYFEPDPSARLFDPALGGGSLLDLGVYLLAYDSFVFGGAAESMDVRGSRTATGVSADAVMTLRRGVATSQLFTTLDTRTPTEAILKGSKAVLEIAAPFYAPASLTLRANDATSTATERYDVLTQADGLCYEAAEAARCIAEGRTESRLHGLDDAIGTLRALDRAERLLG